MQYMFYYASRFDQPLDDWNTGDVTDTSHMFHSASDSAYLQIRLRGLSLGVLGTLIDD